VNHDGSASLAASNFEVSTTGQTCTPLPPGVLAAPTSTPSAADVQVSVRVSDSHPAAGETVTAYGTITVRGAPASASMLTKWYLPTGIATCYALTDVHGVAKCPMRNDNPYYGWVVVVQALFTYNGQTFLANTSYTM
jgi:hypothetical protein